MMTARKTIKVFAAFLLLILLVTGITTGIFLYKLDKGAVSLDFVSDYLDDILNIDGVNFTIGKSSLRIFENGKFPIQVILSDIKFLGNDKNDISIENAVINYAWKDITSFDFNPGIVDINGVKIKSRIEKNNKNSFDILYLVKEFFSLRKLTLEKLRVNNLVYENYLNDGSLVFYVHANETTFDKLNSSVFEFRSALNLKGENKEINLTAEILYNIKESSALLKMRYDGVDPSKINSTIVDIIDVIKNLHSKTKGELVIRFDNLQDKNRDLYTYVKDIHLKIWGEKGKYILGKDIFLFDDISLLIRGGNSLGKIIIENGKLNYEKAAATVTAEVTGIDEYLKTGDRKHIYMAFHAKAKDLPFNRLPNYWPSAISPDVKNWIKTHMKNGTISIAEFDLCYRGVNDDSFVEPDRIDGTANIYDTIVTYMEGMPAVTDASGLVKVHLDRVDIVINKGNTDNLDVKSGIISFYDFDKEVAKADMNLKLYGDMRDALLITDSKPLKYISMIGVNPSRSGGKADFILKLQFPMKEDLSINEVAVDIKGKSTGFSLDLGKVKIAHGNIDFDVNNERARLYGDARINGASSKIDTVINFKEDANFYQQHKIDVWHITGDLEKLFSSIGEIRDPRGMMKSNVVMTYLDENRGNIEVLMDLTNVALDIPLIGINKKIGKKSSLLVVANFANDKIVGNVDFAYRSSSSLITGKAFFSKDGKFQWVDFSQIKTLKTNVSGKIVIGKNNRPEIKISGKELNLSHFLKEKRFTGKKISDFKAKIEVGKLWLSSYGDISQVYLNVDRNNGKFKKIDFSAVTDIRYNPKDVNFTYENGKINCNVGALGSLLKTVVSNSPIGLGRTSIVGTGDINHGKITGEITIDKFIIKDVSFASKILMLASISGITSMTPTGIEFDKAVFPYTYEDGKITIMDGLVSNLSLGLTMKGTADLKDKSLNLNGTVFPVYWANSILGKVPVFGFLFSGEKNGGVFGINYSITGKYPDINWATNPLSFFTPGIVRSLLKDVAEGAEKEQKHKDNLKTQNN